MWLDLGFVTQFNIWCLQVRSMVWLETSVYISNISGF